MATGPRLPVRPWHRWRAAARLVRRASVGKGIRMSAFGGGLNRSPQHFILEGKDGVWDGTEIS